MKYAAAGIVAVGALAVYLARILVRKVKGREPGDSEVVSVKLIGLAIAVIGVALLFLSDRM